MTRITEDDWKAELERLARVGRENRGAEGLTGPEWARRLGKDLRSMRGLLLEAKSRGMLTLGTGFREALDGRMSRVTVYAIKKPANGSGGTRKAAKRARR